MSHEWSDKFLLRSHEPYADLGVDSSDDRRPDRLVAWYKRSTKIILMFPAPPIPVLIIEVPGGEVFVTSRGLL